MSEHLYSSAENPLHEEEDEERQLQPPSSSSFKQSSSNNASMNQHYNNSNHGSQLSADEESRMDRMQSIYDHFQLLGEEIIGGIITLSERPADVVYLDVEKMRAVVERDEIPEASLNQMLFRKYSELATDLHFRHKASERIHNANNTTHYDDMSTIPDELDEQELVGWAAAKKLIFWYRFASASFGFLTFAVMSSVPALSESEYNPSYEFNVRPSLVINV